MDDLPACCVVTPYALQARYELALARWDRIDPPLAKAVRESFRRPREERDDGRAK